MLSPRGILRFALVAFFSMPLIGETFGAPTRESTTAQTTYLEPRGLGSRLASRLASIGVTGYMYRKMSKNNNRIRKLEAKVERLKKKLKASKSRTGPKEKMYDSGNLWRNSLMTPVIHN
ncbi:hypothetical protein GcM3_094030 [Golovinomyces cichoracearum]|uniref:Uncharacterized protein n=1 Tax=Golovinomyces cichoracearum TaxID=62708 RepID=A0A420IFR7_9PEZI|nr:hypothetical protein GcM3_094030 [Golovinomyces cichoracearum]